MYRELGVTISVSQAAEACGTTLEIESSHHSLCPELPFDWIESIDHHHCICPPLPSPTPLALFLFTVPLLLRKYSPPQFMVCTSYISAKETHVIKEMLTSLLLPFSSKASINFSALVFGRWLNGQNLLFGLSNGDVIR